MASGVLNTKKKGSSRTERDTKKKESHRMKRTFSKIVCLVKSSDLQGTVVFFSLVLSFFRIFYFLERYEFDLLYRGALFSFMFFLDYLLSWVLIVSNLLLFDLFYEPCFSVSYEDSDFIFGINSVILYFATVCVYYHILKGLEEKVMGSYYRKELNKNVMGLASWAILDNILERNKKI